MKNAILGYAVGLRSEDIHRFCHSFFKVNKTDDLVLWVSPAYKMAGDLEAFSDRLLLIPAISFWDGAAKDSLKVRWILYYILSRIWVIVTKAFTALGRMIQHNINHSEWRRWTICAVMHPSPARFHFFCGFLQLNGWKYSRVAVSDVRDVIFQCCPFSSLETPELTVFSEPDDRTCGEYRNQRWIRSVFGSVVASQMADLPASCAGFSLGPVAHMLDYFTKLANVLQDSPAIPYSDQGVHNYFLTLGKLHHKRLKNEHGIVLTVGQANREYRIIDNKVTTINEDKIFAVIHQFDRDPQLLKLFQKE